MAADRTDLCPSCVRLGRIEHASRSGAAPLSAVVKDVFGMTRQLHRVVIFRSLGRRGALGMPVLWRWGAAQPSLGLEDGMILREHTLIQDVKLMIQL